MWKYHQEASNCLTEEHSLLWEASDVIFISWVSTPYLGVLVFAIISFYRFNFDAFSNSEAIIF